MTSLVMMSFEFILSSLSLPTKHNLKVYGTPPTIMLLAFWFTFNKELSEVVDISEGSTYKLIDGAGEYLVLGVIVPHKPKYRPLICKLITNQGNNQWHQFCMCWAKELFCGGPNIPNSQPLSFYSFLLGIYRQGTRFSFTKVILNKYKVCVQLAKE